MAKLLCAAFLVLMLAAADSQVVRQSEGKPNTMRRVCGFLTSVHLKPISGEGSKGYEVIQEPLRDATVRLYKREPDKRCCEPSQLLAERKAGWRGTFKMDNQPSGAYWLTIDASSKVYHLPITVEHVGKKARCSEQIFAVWEQDHVIFGHTMSID